MQMKKEVKLFANIEWGLNNISLINKKEVAMTTSNKNFDNSSNNKVNLEPNEQAFYYALKRDDESWVIDTINKIKSETSDESEVIHKLAEDIRIMIVESDEKSIKKMENPAYEEILHYALWSIDCFAIAKRLMQEYGEHTVKAA